MTLEEMEVKLDAKDEEAAKLWMSMARNALVYSTPLFSFRNTDMSDRLDFAGSGTFIREGDRYFILTARRTSGTTCSRDGDAVGVVLREVHDHRYFIETKAITPYDPEAPKQWNNLGPDIVVLEIPPSAVGTIKAMRGFYEMDGGLKAMVDGSQLRGRVGRKGLLLRYLHRQLQAAAR
jgi:hypothetical protein